MIDRFARRFTPRSAPSVLATLGTETQSLRSLSSPHLLGDPGLSGLACARKEALREADGRRMSTSWMCSASDIMRVVVAMANRKGEGGSQLPGVGERGDGGTGFMTTKK